MDESASESPKSLEIPIDVLYLIFAYLPSSTLSTCCRLSKRTYSIAFDALHRHLRPTSRNILDVLFRLSQPLPGNVPASPELLASKVHSFVLSEDKTNFEMFLGNIQDILPKLSRLKVLVLDLGPMSGWVLPKVSSNKQPPPFRLAAFHCSLRYDDVLEEFLRAQTDIRTLAIRAPVSKDVDIGSLSAATFLPNLRCLQVPWELAVALVPGRPISDLVTRLLFMNSTQDHPHNAATVNDRPELQDLSCLSLSTAEGGVKRLFINWSFLSIPGPEQLGQSIPGISKLSIDADGVDPSSELNQDEIVEYLANLLPYTKHLESIYIRFHPMRALIPLVPCQEIDYSEMIDAIFRSSGSSGALREVAITFLGLKAKYLYRRDDVDSGWSIVNGWE